MDKKLTDSEIVKALECCADVNGANCHECPYDECCSYPKSTMLEDALDLINRLQAKVIKEQNKNSKLRNERNRLQAMIERLKEENRLLSENADTAFNKMD